MDFKSSYPKFLDVYFGHPSTDRSVDISTDTRPKYRPSVDRYIGRHVGRHSADIYRPRYVGRHIDRLSADIAVDIAADTRPIRWPLIVGGVSVNCRWDIGRLSYNISQKLKRSLGRCSHYFTFRKHAFKTTEQRWDEVWNTLMQGRSQKKIMTEAMSVVKLLSWYI